MKKKHIAYLSHEIPGVSSTFVYNEIINHQSNGYIVDSFSIHPANNPNNDVQELTEKTKVLYKVSLWTILNANFSAFLRKPLAYLKLFIVCLRDICSAGRGLNFSLGLLYRMMVGVYLARQLSSRDVEHLHVHFSDIPADIAMYASLYSDIPFSVTAHANDIFQRSWLVKEKVARSKFYATISNYNLQWFERFGADLSKIHIVRCGVDSAHFQKRPFKTKSSPVRLGLVGRLVEKKGIHILIEASSKLFHVNEDFIVEIVGDGPQKKEIQGLISRYNLDEKVKLLGSKPHSDISEWLNSIDYFVLPCVKDSSGDMDGIPVALMEAMLKGVPVVSSNISGVPELVIDGSTGKTAETGSAESLAKVLNEILEESQETVDLRVSKAEALVRSEYDQYKNAQRLRNLIA